MKKMNKKFVSVMATAALAAGVVAPIAPVATSSVSAAAGEIVATNVPSVSDDETDVALGTVRVTIPAGTNIGASDSVVVKLPLDTSVDFHQNSVTVGQATYDNQVAIPTHFNGEVNGIGTSDLTVNKLGKDRIRINFAGTPGVLTTDAVFFIQAGKVKMENGKSGGLEVSLEASPNSAFPSGRVVAANANSQGQVNLSVSSLDHVNDNFTPTIHIAESVAGAFTRDNEIKIKLPNGYRFDKSGINNTTETLVTYGDSAAKAALDFSYSDADRELIIKFATSANGFQGTSQPTKLEIKTPFIVDDEALARPGDIVARVSGKTNVNVSEVVIGVYGDYSSAVTEVSTTDIIAGKLDQVIGDFKITESVGSTLTNGRTVTVTLPDGARWAEAPNIRTNESVRLTNPTFVGSDRRTLRYTVSNAQLPSADPDPATITLEKGEVNLDAAFSGELTLDIAGSAGVEGSVTVAEVTAPVTASASSNPSVIIGQSGQTASDFIITEGIAGAFGNKSRTVQEVVVGPSGTPTVEDVQVRNNRVVINLPEGAKFVGTPKVEVTDGDLSITDVKVSTFNGESDRAITFTVNGESTEASTITVSDVKVQLDRTIPEGSLEVEIGGSSLVETADIGNFSHYASRVKVANVSTPAPSDTTAEVEFVIGSATYTVNGVERTADVAPFIENGRTFLPVRFVAEAVGVSENNIIWNDAARTVTIIKGDRVAQLTIGSNILTVNGVNVPMDVNAFIRDDRTYLPISFVAQALGLNVEWDDAARTVTIN